MSPGENTRPILKKKKMILSLELIEENTYARTLFDNGNRALKLKRKPSWQIVLQSRIRQFSEPLCCQIEGVR